jgi:hypothetical protein
MLRPTKGAISARSRASTANAPLIRPAPSTVASPSQGQSVEREVQRFDARAAFRAPGDVGRTVDGTCVIVTFDRQAAHALGVGFGEVDA